MLPEMETYIKQNPEMAATLTHKESGYIAEVAEAAALASSFHVLVDGSLRDADWYIGVFKRIREQYPHYRIGILHVIAAPAKVYRRAEKRSRKVRAALMILLPRSTCRNGAPHATADWPCSAQACVGCVHFLCAAVGAAAGSLR